MSIHALPQETAHTFPSVREYLVETAYKTAAYLSDPACKTRELYVQLLYAESLDPTADCVSRWAKKCWLFSQMTTCGVAALVTTLPGIFLRAFGNYINDNPFLYKKGEAKEKPFSENIFTLFSWNICCVPAGYPITDGNVTPWPQRIHGIINKISEQNADVVCLYEVFDTHAGFNLYEALKDQYAHFYLNIGTQALGAPSGMFVACKYPVDNAHFHRFSKKTLVGRTKFAAKGCFAFDIQQARIFSTHLQHSEIPSQPTEEEITGRKKQMSWIVNQMQLVKKLTPILTGDLNLDSTEFQKSTWSELLTGAIHFKTPTWGGDQFCARMQGKSESDPCNLDYTAYYSTEAKKIETHQVTTGFDQTQYNPSALSDHNGLHSEIHL